MANTSTVEERAYYKAVREAARQRGDKTYQGFPCKNGHNGVRYVKGKGQCVSCFCLWQGRVHSHTQQNRRLAQERGINKYDGRPCKRGHSGKRYTTSGQCVTCTSIAASERQKRIGTTDRQRQQVAAWNQANKPKCMWNRARNRASRAGLDFNIEVEDIVILDTCPVFKVPMVSPSLDRVDNSKGYVKGNVRVISKRANTLKNSMNLEEVEAIADYMREHQSTA